MDALERNSSKPAYDFSENEFIRTCILYGLITCNAMTAPKMSVIYHSNYTINETVELMKAPNTTETIVVDNI